MKCDRYKDAYKAYLEALINALQNGGEKPVPPVLKAYGSMYESEQRFRTDIEKTVNVNAEGGIPLTVAVRTAFIDRTARHICLSESNFLHLYDLAVSLHSRRYLDREEEADPGEMQRVFEHMSLEYKLSHLHRAQSFGKHLHAIHCFYTDKPVDFAPVRAFTPEQTAVIAPMEHERRIREHQAMGWKQGNFYESEEALTAAGTKCTSGDLREQLRMHKLAMDGALTEEDIRQHYEGLSERDKGKDRKPFNSMLRLLRQFDGLRIYRL